MFGEKVSRGPEIDEWLEQLRVSEPATQRGELVSRNLVEDGNVCAAHQSALFAHIKSVMSGPTTMDAAGMFTQFLCALSSTVPCCTQTDNSVNRLPNPPFDRLARVVDGDSFVKYNFLSGKRRVPRRFRGKASVRAKVRLDEIRKRNPRASELSGHIGGPVVFATSAEIVDRRSRDEIDDNELRDRLGLDDSRFGRDRFMVVYTYSADRVPGNEFYRPNVLDAGWSDVSAAFLPSAPGPAGPGRTQNLKKGEHAEPEIVHPSFPTNQIEAYVALGPLTTDPPTDYKSIRLKV